MDPIQEQVAQGLGEPRNVYMGACMILMGHAGRLNDEMIKLAVANARKIAIEVAKTHKEPPP